MDLVRRSSRLLGLAMVAFSFAACVTNRGPEDPTPVAVPRLVTTSVQYRQPNGCFNIRSSCDGPVVFFASWMPQGTYVVLQQEPGTYFWKAYVSGVPVNYPPRDQPYLVHVFDPYLTDTATGGVTVDRLQVGGQAITKVYQYGTPDESGLIYIDDNGFGHSPL